VTRLSDKYIAGFLDADGCIAVNLKAGKYKPLLEIKFSQKTSQDEVLSRIQEAAGGRIHVREIKGTWYSSLEYAGAPAEKLLNRIKQYLVIKRYYAEACLRFVEAREPCGDPKAARARLKAERKIPSLPIPKHATRKWLAAYVDGDGCFSARVNSSKSAIIELSIASSSYDTEGLEVVQKMFGGRIYYPKGGYRVLKIHLSPSKAREMLNYFGKHLIVKKDQADFILGCAEMGHYRDGKSIKAALKQLKAQPHRLNEPGADVAKLLNEVKDLPQSWRDKKTAQATVGTT